MVVVVPSMVSPRRYNRKSGVNVRCRSIEPKGCLSHESDHKNLRLPEDPKIGLPVTDLRQVLRLWFGDGLIPVNPRSGATHLNYRYFEILEPRWDLTNLYLVVLDLTPSYLYEEDGQLFTNCTGCLTSTTLRLFHAQAQ